MKRCPTCNQTFADEALSFCLSDGSRLVSDSSTAPTDELQATMMATPPSLGGGSYPAPPPQSAPGSGSFNPPPPNQSWPAPSVPNKAATPKSGGVNKKLIFGGLGCVALIAIVGIVGIVLLFAFSGASSKMSPYKGELKALTPETVGSYRRGDIDPLKDIDKKSLGKVSEGMDVDYKSSSNVDIKMLVCNYASSEDAEEGLKSFSDEGVNNGWKRSEKESKRIGWRTVGIHYLLTKDFSTSKADERLLPGGASIVRTQTSSTESKRRQFVMWTNGSVIYVAGGVDNTAVDFEKIFDTEVK